MSISRRRSFRNHRRATSAVGFYLLLMATGCKDTHSEYGYEFLASPKGCVNPLHINATQEKPGFFSFRAPRSPCYFETRPVIMVEMSNAQIKRITDLAYACTGMKFQAGYEYLFVKSALEHISKESCKIRNQEDVITISYLAPYLNFFSESDGIATKASPQDEVDIIDPFSDALSNNIVAVYHAPPNYLGASLACIVKTDPNMGTQSDLKFHYDRVQSSKSCIEQSSFGGVTDNVE